MKRSIAVFILLFLTSSGAGFAGKVSEVALRFSNQENNIKLVLESDGDFIKNTNAVVSLSSITVEFPSRFELKKQKDFLFPILKKENSLSINLKGIVDAKAYKLTSPARLVIDLRSGTGQQTDSRKSDQKAQQPQSPDQKKTQDISPQVSPKNPDLARPRPQNGQNGQKPPIPPPPVPSRRKVIVIDPGHGGYEYGLVQQNSKEKDVNLAIARELAAGLLKKGATVFLTRKVDQNASLADRINFANSKSPDLFISIHSAQSDKFVIYTATVDDATVETAVKQYSQFSNQNRYIERSRGAAKAIADSLHTGLNALVLQRELPLPVLTSIKAPAVLIEYPALKAYDADQKLRESLMNCFLKGIVNE